MESEWADFIAKIDNYHEKVQKQIPEMLLKLKATGMSVGIVCKYGFQMPPIVAGQDAQSDNLITVSSQSIGATEAKQGTVFSDKYLADAKTKGTDKYISPDRVIDASTGLLPENTWFVKDVWHQIMPVGIDPLLVTIARSPKEMTVWDNPEFPQYLLYSAESDSMSPLTKDNCNTEPPEHSLFQAVIRFFKSVYSLIKEKLTELINKEA